MTTKMKATALALAAFFASVSYAQIPPRPKPALPSFQLHSHPRPIVSLHQIVVLGHLELYSAPYFQHAIEAAKPAYWVLAPQISLAIPPPKY